MPDPERWIPWLFALITLIFGLWTLSAASSSDGMRDPKVKARTRITLAFALTTFLLFLWL